MSSHPAKILLATDGSEDAALAATAATDLCKAFGSELHVVHAWHSVPSAHFQAFLRAQFEQGGQEYSTIRSSRSKAPGHGCGGAPVRGGAGGRDPGPRRGAWGGSRGTGGEAINKDLGSAPISSQTAVRRR